MFWRFWRSRGSDLWRGENRDRIAKSQLRGILRQDQHERLTFVISAVTPAEMSFFKRPEDDDGEEELMAKVKNSEPVMPHPDVLIDSIVPLRPCTLTLSI